MFRIIFSTSEAHWVVQLQVYGMFWSTVKDKEFANYEDALLYVQSTGIDRVYRDYRSSMTHNLMQGGQPQQYILRAGQ